MAETVRNDRIEAEAGESAETETGIDPNVAGALAYVFGIVTGLVFYLVEKENEFVRFHAAQSIAFSVSVFVLYVGLSIVGAVVSALTFSGGSGAFVAFSVVSLVITLAWFAVTVGSFLLWIYLMVRAYQGETPRIPVVAGFADQLR